MPATDPAQAGLSFVGTARQCGYWPAAHSHADRVRCVSVSHRGRRSPHRPAHAVLSPAPVRRGRKPMGRSRPAACSAFGVVPRRRRRLRVRGRHRRDPRRPPRCRPAKPAAITRPPKESASGVRKVECRVVCGSGESWGAVRHIHDPCLDASGRTPSSAARSRRDRHGGHHLVVRGDDEQRKQKAESAGGFPLSRLGIKGPIREPAAHEVADGQPRCRTTLAAN